MSGPAISSTLLVAALDLNLVQLLRQAIRTADATGAAEAAGSGNRLAASSPAQAAQQMGVRSVGLQNSDHSAASYHPAQVLHFHPRLNAMQPIACDRPVPAINAPAFIQPPWKVLPWPIAGSTYCGSHNHTKVTVTHTDASDVGRTLDLFI